jgi:hypothetical protein
MRSQSLNRKEQLDDADPQLITEAEELMPQLEETPTEDSC